MAVSFGYGEMKRLTNDEELKMTAAFLFVVCITLTSGAFDGCEALCSDSTVALLFQGGSSWPKLSLSY